MAHVMNTTASAPFSMRLRAVVESIKTSVAMYNDYKRTYNELASLSERDLADINIRRVDLRKIAREHVYGA